VFQLNPQPPIARAQLQRLSAPGRQRHNGQ